MSQFEAFATFKSPSVKIYNLTALGTTPTSLLFDVNPATRAATGTGTTTITCANTFELAVGQQVVSVTTLVIPANTVIVSINAGVSIVVNNVVAVSAVGTIRFLSNNFSLIARCRITNLSTVNAVAIQFCDITQTTLPTVGGNTAGFVSPATTSPTFTASTFSCSSSGALVIGDGIRIQPNSSLEVNIGLNTRMWIVASAAATPVQVAAVLQNG